MSKTVPVSYEGKPCYKIKIEHNFCELINTMKDVGYESTQKVCVVTDSNLAELHLDGLVKLLSQHFDNVITFVFNAGESSKNMDTVQLLYQELIKKHFDRHDVLIAFGGGVVGDLTGFCAATYLRGIDFIQIPTSLLSQVDSSIGGKTGVDFLQYKNMVGAFYQPKLVYMNLSLLQTLSKDQFASGMAEIIKHGLIKDNDYYLWLRENSTRIMQLDADYLEEMVYKSCLIKRGVVECDPKEMGERALLNFGHTIGHAVEKLADFKLSHGQCVALGIAAAADISCKLGNIAPEAYEDIIEVLSVYDLPVKLSEDMTKEEILGTSKSDKKMEAGIIKFILLQNIGDAYIDKTLSDGQIQSGILSIL